jgi:hypothetical protein
VREELERRTSIVRELLYGEKYKIYKKYFSKSNFKKCVNFIKLTDLLRKFYTTKLKLAYLFICF